jgi:hypothetical protein
MTHHARLNLIMFATITGLMVFLYFRPQPQVVPEHAISNNTAEAVQHLRIVRQQQDIALEQLNGQWRLTEPVQAWADGSKVAEILEILQATSPQRLPLDDPARFGLERPNMQLYIDDAYFGFGGFAPTTSLQYVAAGDHVYLLSPRYALALPAGPGDLINPKLLSPGEIPVKFELPDITLTFHNENWHMTLQQPDDVLDEETIRRWVQLLQTARAAKVILPSELSPDFIEAGLMAIGLQDGQTIALKILQTDYSIVLFRMNEGIGYQFSVDAGQPLLHPNTLKLDHTVPES